MPWYDELYSVRIRDEAAPDWGTVYRYLGRRFAQRWEGPYDDTPAHYLKRANRLITLAESAGLNSTHRVLIVGAVWGYLIAAFRLRGYPLVWGLELDNYFIANHASEALPDLDVSDTIEQGDIRDISRQQLKSKLIQRTGDWQFHLIITDDIATSTDYTNSDLATIANACEQALFGMDTRRIVHIVSDLKPDVTPDATALTYMRFKTLAEWAALRPAHTWISDIDGQYIVGQVV